MKHSFMPFTNKQQASFIPEFKYWLRIHGFRLKWFVLEPKTIQSRLNQKKERNESNEISSWKFIQWI